MVLQTGSQFTRFGADGADRRRGWPSPLVRETGTDAHGNPGGGTFGIGHCFGVGFDAGDRTSRCHARYGDGPKPQVGNAAGAGGDFDVAAADGAERFHWFARRMRGLRFSLRLNAVESGRARLMRWISRTSCRE